MRIKTRVLSYQEVAALPKPKHLKPIKPLFILRTVIRILAIFDLFKVNFKFEGSFKGKEPCLILMNHSSFIDLKIAHRLLYPKPFGIVCTSDGFVGKRLLMRLLGCIPTKKFVSDVGLIRDMKYLLKEKKISVLMYPEASYSFDGTATPLPRKLGILLKKLDVPVVHIDTKGAFLLDPLYNGLRVRKTNVSATIKCLLTREEIKEKSVEELDGILDAAFSFDHFKWQRENNVKITEDFRGIGLERILYRCPNCETEGGLEGAGISLTCHNCSKVYTLSELGELKASKGKTEFSHIPDWYRWERECVRKEISDGSYRLDTKVKIGMMVDYKAIYMVDEGRLTHTSEGFTLTGCDGKLNYTQKPQSSYGLYADYFWYEIGDVICIGDASALYYCFPEKSVAVAKARLAAEEMYKIYLENRKKNTVKT